jgi:ferredoxin
MKTKCVVHHGNQVHSFEVSKSENLLKTLRKNNIPVPFSCGGEGICTTCRVLIEEGKVSPRTDLEKERSDERGFRTEERLSCQCFPVSDYIRVKIP